MGLIGKKRCMERFESTKVEIEWVLLGIPFCSEKCLSTKVEIEWVLLGRLPRGAPYIYKSRN